MKNEKKNPVFELEQMVLKCEKKIVNNKNHMYVSRESYFYILI